MKKIFTSDYHNHDKNYASMERVVVYQIENEDEYWDFSNMTHEERCNLFDVFDEGRYYVAPGARYYTYSFDYSPNHIVVYERVSMNV